MSAAEQTHDDGGTRLVVVTDQHKEPAVFTSPVTATGAVLLAHHRPVRGGTPSAAARPEQPTTSLPTWASAWWHAVSAAVAGRRSWPTPA